MPKKTITDICEIALGDNKAVDILSLDIKGISSFADVIIIATASSNRHAKSLSEKVVEAVKKNKMTVLGVEGKAESGWILVDCGEVGGLIGHGMLQALEAADNVQIDGC